MPAFLFLSKIFKADYFFSAAFSFEAQQAFLSFEEQSFAFAHSSVFAFALSSFVKAEAVEAVKPIVKANANTIANFFMISIFK